MGASIYNAQYILRFSDKYYTDNATDRGKCITYVTLSMTYSAYHHRRAATPCEHYQQLFKVVNCDRYSQVEYQYEFKEKDGYIDKEGDHQD